MCSPVKSAWLIEIGFGADFFVLLCRNKPIGQTIYTLNKLITLIPITSLAHPELAPYRTLRQSVEQFHQGKFVGEGKIVVRRLLESTYEILSVLMTSEWLEEYRELLVARPEKITVFLGRKELLNTIVGYNLHQSIMALGKIPTQATLDSVLIQSSPPCLFVAVDGLANSENLGVLVRNCVAFGVQTILVGETSSSPYLRRAVRNSMGTVFKIPIVHCKNLVETLTILRHSHKFKVVAAHTHAEEYNIQRVDFTEHCCIVFGSEGDGISPRVLSVCDITSAIPMQLGVDSLNVASASAVFLYEAMRQRNKR
jgi:tRNA G18 (ribose-2'-O)-methylase SpoU